MTTTISEKPPGQHITHPVIENADVATTNIWIWKPWQKVAFRISFIFFIIMSIPSGAEWWVRTFKLDWLHPNYRDIYDIARFLPDMPFVKHYQKGFWSFNDWYVILAVSVIGGITWTLLDRHHR